MRLKIFYRKNLGMSPGKLAAQCVHVALRFAGIIDPSAAVIVLGASDKKFEEFKKSYTPVLTVRDAGRTEVAPGTETVAAILERE